MDTVLGHRLESAEGVNSRLAGSAHQARGIPYPVVVRDPDDFNADIEAGLYYRCVVVGFRCEWRWLAMPLKIGVGIDLQCAAVETRAVGKLQGGLHAF